MRDQPARDLFLVSWLLLFLELACIRWFPAHVLYLTFFTNVILLASFLGMSLGLLAARGERDFLRLTPVFLVVAMLLAHGLESRRAALAANVRVSGVESAQQV